MPAAVLVSCLSLPRPESGRIPDARNFRVAEKVLRALEQERNGRRQHGRAEDLFAVFYLPVTEGVPFELKAGRLEYPNFWCEVIEAFHADWVRNEQTARREAHWRPSYEKAAALQHRCLTTVQTAVLLPRGIEAHIDVDLPRVLRKVWQRHPELDARDAEGLKTDFFHLAAVFAHAAQQGFAEMDQAAARRPGWLIRVTA